MGCTVLFRQDSTNVRDLYGRYASWLRAVLGARYGAEEAEDLAQDVWLRVVPYSAHVEIRHPPSLLLKIAANLVADRAAAKSRTRCWETHQPECLSGLVWDAQTEELLAKEIILGLPQPLRDVFVLSRFGGLTNSQIAEQLGIRPKTVEWRMTKALAHCAAQFRR